MTEQSKFNIDTATKEEWLSKVPVSIRWDLMERGMEELIHYSPVSLLNIKAVVQRDEPTMKPNGFWFSVRDEWREWCEGEEWELERLKLKYLVELSPQANILHLTKSEQLDAFSAKYISQPNWLNFSSTMYVDWKRVAENWQGIIIDPYFWSHRLDMSCSWYYGWDCASGCVWDAGVIKSLTLDETWNGVEKDHE